MEIGRILFFIFEVFWLSEGGVGFIRKIFETEQEALEFKSTFPFKNIISGIIERPVTTDEMEYFE
jgi:hypothetical protein